MERTLRALELLERWSCRTFGQLALVTARALGVVIVTLVAEVCRAKAEEHSNRAAVSAVVKAEKRRRGDRNYRLRETARGSKREREREDAKRDRQGDMGRTICIRGTRCHA